MKWKILDTGRSSAEENMQIDADLLQNLDDQPILHLYDWEQDSATFGHFIDPSKHLLEAGVQKRRLHLAKRPTGGGILLHLWDFTFSILLPATHPAFSQNTLENYQIINGFIVSILKKMCQKTPFTFFEKKSGSFHKSFCMANPTIYDVMLEGKKVGGAAQRRKKQGLLHQSSIALVAPEEEYLYDIFPKDVVNAMLDQSFFLHASKETLKELLIGNIDGLNNFREQDRAAEASR